MADWRKRTAIGATVFFAGFWVYTDPEGAANATKAVGGFVASVFEGTADFVGELFPSDESSQSSEFTPREQRLGETADPDTMTFTADAKDELTPAPEGEETQTVTLAQLPDVVQAAAKTSAPTNTSSPLTP